jgi:1-phosphatidylinositol-4-phosphate 5-kinase
LNPGNKNIELELAL